jgi:hypothetical protein
LRDDAPAEQKRCVENAQAMIALDGKQPEDYGSSPAAMRPML